MAVSIQQAAAKAFAGWLGQRLGDVKVEDRWPAPDRRFVNKTITVVPAGNRRDTPIDMRILSKVNTGDTDTTATIQIAACYQPFQLDIWATSHLERDDMMARLDEYLNWGERGLSTVVNPDPLGHGVLIAVQDGWQASGTIADFTFDNPDIDDTASSVERASYRATYRGGAHFHLALPVVVARQKVGKLSLYLDGDPVGDRTVYTP